MFLRPATGPTLAFLLVLGSPAGAADSTQKASPAGRFSPTWDSLTQYEVPDWFRDAKFGIWAHWGPQCQPEQGDWYARHMYIEGHRQNLWHVANLGPPSKVGFKDVIHSWKAENWDPEKLLALYKRAGAQYFFALANHHDNLDLWPSKHQKWNSVNVGPKKDLVGGWAKAARAQGLRFGVSVHAAHAWTWYETSRNADKAGPLAGVPYDGGLTAADGKGLWWEGLDPQELYGQNHPRSTGSEDPASIHKQWSWDNGASIPDVAWIEKFHDRTVDLIDTYRPDLLYFDDTVLPFHAVSDAGVRIAAHFYNSNMKWNGGKLEAVLFGKILDDEHRKRIVWDVERGAPNRLESRPWQTDTCLGDWHYQRSIFEQHKYKSTKTVLQTLADIVSKNGNLLLNVPVRGDGTIDDDEVAIVEGIGRWMDVNREAIFGTRPWTVYGEGPAADAAAPLTAQGFNEGKGKPFTEADVRFTTKADAVYAIVLDTPTRPVVIRALGTTSLAGKRIATVQRLGTADPARWSQTAEAGTIEAAAGAGPEGPVVFKIALR